MLINQNQQILSEQVAQLQLENKNNEIDWSKDYVFLTCLTLSLPGVIF